LKAAPMVMGSNTSLLYVFINLVQLVADHQDGVDQGSPDQDFADLIASDSCKGYAYWRCYLSSDY